MGAVVTDAALWIDPGRQFGHVCVYGTRVAATTVAESVWLGEDPVADYRITHRQALVACWWVATNTTRTWSKRWGQWAHEAFGGLWQVDGRLPPYPPRKDDR